MPAYSHIEPIIIMTALGYVALSVLSASLASAIRERQRHSGARSVSQNIDVVKIKKRLAISAIVIVTPGANAPSELLYSFGKNRYKHRNIIVCVCKTDNENKKYVQEYSKKHPKQKLDVVVYDRPNLATADILSIATRGINADIILPVAPDMVFEPDALKTINAFFAVNKIVEACNFSTSLPINQTLDSLTYYYTSALKNIAAAQNNILNPDYSTHSLTPGTAIRYATFMKIIHEGTYSAVPTVQYPVKTLNKIWRRTQQMDKRDNDIVINILRDRSKNIFSLTRLTKDAIIGFLHPNSVYVTTAIIFIALSVVTQNILYLAIFIASTSILFTTVVLNDSDTPKSLRMQLLIYSPIMYALLLPKIIMATTTKYFSNKLN